MDVDNVVYISDIDAELSSDDEDPETKGKLVFIPDIERELTRIPHHVLRPRKDDKDTSAGDGGKGQALVLYSDPRSLSVVEEKDSVRKAIIESRARLRMKQAAENEARLLATEAGQEEVQPQSLAPPPVIGTGFPGGGYAGFGAEMINSGGGGVVSGWYGGTNSINNGGGGGGGGYDSDVDMDAMDVE
ncbi:hypothetical protein EDC01DRAFT_23092 [Geopyxis carbonaria]|nr:hypothetical protein EDC01DRAFT_23092 [Geopyxis carbonaria]